MKRMICLPLVIACILVLVIGCTSADDAAQPGQNMPGQNTEAVKGESTKTTLIYGVGTDATTMDPHFANNTPTGNALVQVHETLTAWDSPDTMNLVGKLAKDWEVSADGLTWTFYLREGITFHDGAAFNAEAVKKNFERILDPALAAPRRSLFDMMVALEVVDEYTVNIITAEPYAALPSLLTSYNACIMSPKTTEEYGDKYSVHASGTGPFKLAAWTPGEEMTFERNEDYWGEKPAIQTLIFKIIPEDPTRVMAVQTGEVDIISNVPPYEINNLTSRENINVSMDEGFRTIYLGFNMKRAPFDDVRVRQAINYAINREDLIYSFLEGAATMAVGPEATSIPGASSDLFQYTYNPEKAKQLLAEAGYADGFEINFVSPHGRYIMDRQIAEAIQAQLAEIGIKANLQVLDFSILLELLTNGEEAELFLMGKGSPASDLDYTAQLFWPTGASNNWSFLSTPKIDELVAKQRATMDLQERQEILQKMQEEIQAELPWASLYYEKQVTAMSKALTGVKIWPYEVTDFSGAAFE